MGGLRGLGVCIIEIVCPENKREGAHELSGGNERNRRQRWTRENEYAMNRTEIESAAHSTHRR